MYTCKLFSVLVTSFSLLLGSGIKNNTSCVSWS